MNTGIPTNPRLLTNVSHEAPLWLMGRPNRQLSCRSAREERHPRILAGSSAEGAARHHPAPRWQRGARLARDRTRSRGAVGTRGGWQRSRLGVQFLISSSYSWKDASATRRAGRPATGATTPLAPARRRPRAPKTGEMDRVTRHPHSAQCPRCKLFSQESLNHLNHGGP
jgi:hypothetical protein